MEQIKKMFEHQGKTTNVIGNSRIKAYRDLYNHISEKQGKDLPYHGDYLSDNELAKSIYQKKYYLKNLDNEYIETQPEDVFKRPSKDTLRTLFKALAWNSAIKPEPIMPIFKIRGE